MPHLNFLYVVRADADRHLVSWGKGLTVATLLRLALLTPGFQLVFAIRVQHAVGLIPVVGTVLRRCVWYFNWLWFGCDFDPKATVGPGLYVPHPIGIVVGGEWDLCENVTLLHGVTLGRTVSPTRRCLVGSGSLIGAGAKIVGQIDLGANSKVGANAVVLKSVPDNGIAVGVPARIRFN